MKIFLKKYLISAVAVLVIFTVSCEDYNELSDDPVASGQVNFDTYVAVGNSLTAGFQSGALYESAQKFSYPNLLARQFQQVQEFS